jgi:hypothetical protein
MQEAAVKPDSPTAAIVAGLSTGPGLMDARDRYRQDPLFNRVVEQFRAILRDHTMTPSELREALMLAAYCEELENPSPVFYRIGSLQRILSADLETMEQNRSPLSGVNTQPTHQERRTHEPSDRKEDL